MTSISPERIAELTRLCREATPGPWTIAFEDSTKVKDAKGDSLVIMYQTHLRGRREANEVERTARLIAAAREAIPALLAEREEMRAALIDVMEWIDNWTVPFTEDEAWPETRARVASALSSDRKG